MSDYKLLYTKYPPWSNTTSVHIITHIDDYLHNVFHSFNPEMTTIKETPPTRAERLGHQPRQAAGDLGPGEVVVIEALDGRDDEGPPHPSVICRISHLLSLWSPATL